MPPQCSGRGRAAPESDGDQKGDRELAGQARPAGDRSGDGERHQLAAATESTTTLAVVPPGTLGGTVITTAWPLAFDVAAAMSLTSTAKPL
jgi:hypothetical protein